MKKILLVEDDIALSAGLCFELEEEDYLTVAAHSLKRRRDSCWRHQNLICCYWM